MPFAILIDFAQWRGQTRDRRCDEHVHVLEKRADLARHQVAVRHRVDQIRRRVALAIFVAGKRHRFEIVRPRLAAVAAAAKSTEVRRNAVQMTCTFSRKAFQS